MPSLYSISAETKYAIDEVMNLEDVPENVIADTLESIGGELTEKQVNVAAYVLNLRGDVRAMKEYEETMKERRKSLEKKITWLTESIMTSMQMHNQSSVPDIELTIKRKLNPPRVVIDNDRILPTEYLRVIKEPDKAKLKESLLAGVEILGAHIERTERLEIK